jgi:formimidoylglutamate deiminase
MYARALRITPQQLEAIAAFLYAELLAAGYTQVCEFHYLHNDHDGRPYADPLEMSLALVRAARRVGIGLTLLPTLYMRSGFGATGLRADQRRFASAPDRGAAQSPKRCAATPAPITGSPPASRCIRCAPSTRAPCANAPQAARAAGMPVHIHIAEQQLEVEDCLRQHGLRPIDWLLRNAPVDAGWNLVHATQAKADELQALQATGAAIVLCPSTEANLGDGVFDLPAWQAGAGAGPWDRTATSRAAGPRSCACWNTRSASCCASATWPRARPVRRARRRPCWRPPSTAAAPRPVCRSPDWPWASAPTSR